MFRGEEKQASFAFNAVKTREWTSFRFSGHGDGGVQGRRPWRLASFGSLPGSPRQPYGLLRLSALRAQRGRPLEIGSRGSEKECPSSDFLSQVVRNTLSETSRMPFLIISDAGHLCMCFWPPVSSWEKCLFRYVHFSIGLFAFLTQSRVS